MDIIFKKRTLNFLGLFFYLSIALGCGFGGTHNGMRHMVGMKIVKGITYRFNDASLPPQYHRSYTITVSEGGAHIAVDSYGDVLAEKDYPISDSQFKVLLSAFQTYKIRNCKLPEGNGCTGGTTEKISLSNGGK